MLPIDTYLLMLHFAALPFVLRRDHSVISGREVTSTREELHGLLRLDGSSLFVQWRTMREISRVGREIRTDHELVPIREVVIPLSGLAGARIRKVWRWWRRVEVLVLTAGDMRAFDLLTEAGGVPGLVLEHPAELTLELRRSDSDLAREFVSELMLAITEETLHAMHLEPIPHHQDRLEIRHQTTVKEEIRVNDTPEPASPRLQNPG